MTLGMGAGIATQEMDVERARAAKEEEEAAKRAGGGATAEVASAKEAEGGAAEGGVGVPEVAAASKAGVAKKNQVAKVAMDSFLELSFTVGGGPCCSLD